MRPGLAPMKTAVVVSCLAMVAVAVATALSYFARPSDDRTKLQTAAERLVRDLKFAQADAIANHQGQRLVVFHNQGYHVAAAADAATPLANDDDDDEPFVITFGIGSARPLDGIAVLSLSVGDDDMLGFGTQGQLDQASIAKITLATGSHSITITVDPISGVASVSEPFKHDKEPMPSVHRVEENDGSGSRG